MGGYINGNIGVLVLALSHIHRMRKEEMMMGVREEAQMARGGIMEEVTRLGNDLVRKSIGELKMELIETRPGDELLKPGGQKLIKIKTFLKSKHIFTKPNIPE